MRLTVKKWGNSASVRLPAAIMQAARLELDMAVEMRAENGRIVIEPIRDEAYVLEDLIAGITTENAHGEVDFGEPVGKESF